MKLPASVSFLARLRASGSLVGIGLGIVAFAGTFSAACGGDSGAKITDDSKDNADDGNDDRGGDAGPGTPSDDPGGFDPGGSDAATGSDDSCKKMDIVFVVDNSGSMSQEQDNLVQNFPKFGAIIDGYKTKNGDVLDYRLAVATTDAGGGKGAFVKKASGGSTPPWWPFPSDNSGSCDAGPDRPWIERGDGKPVDFFACRARVGTGGSGNERPLASLHLGLTDRIKDGTNASNGSGFLRDDALLAFVVLTDEDESSNTPPISDYPAMFDAVKGGERGRWAAAVIAGETKCSSKQFGSATEAKKLKEFVTDVGKNGVFSSICEGDLTPGVTKALTLFDQACKSFPTGPN